MDDSNDAFPDKVLVNMFTFLHPKVLMKCRYVCSSWREVIDELNDESIIWCRNCRKDYPDICDSAYFKSIPILDWHQLYRSLSLWDKLLQAEEHVQPFYPVRRDEHTIIGFQILRNSVMGIHKIKGITYYDYTIMRAFRRNIRIACVKYSENEHIVAMHNENLDLHTIHKESWNSVIGSRNRVRYVESCLLIDTIIYYVKHIHPGDDICLYKESNGIFVNRTLVNVREGVLCLGSRNGLLYILTNTLDIYGLEGNELRLVWNFEIGKTCREFINFNFLEKIVWSKYYQKVTERNNTEAVNEISAITKIRVYGSKVFVGNNEGVFCIYNAEPTDDIFTILRSAPIKQYNLMLSLEIEKATICPILEIDVVEGVDSHKIMIAMPKHFTYIRFKHDYMAVKRRTANEPSTSHQR